MYPALRLLIRQWRIVGSNPTSGAIFANNAQSGLFVDVLRRAASLNKRCPSILEIGNR